MLIQVVTWSKTNVLMSLVKIYTVCMIVMSGKQREATNAQIWGKYEWLKLWWKLYVMSLPERDLWNFRPLDFWWTEFTCNVHSKYNVPGGATYRNFTVSVCGYLNGLVLCQRVVVYNPASLCVSEWGLFCGIVYMCTLFCWWIIFKRLFSFPPVCSWIIVFFLYW